MKLSPNDQVIQAKMKPGVLTGEGFLGDDTRNFRDIIAEDMKIVNTLPHSLEEIALRMAYFMDESFLSYDGPIVIDTHYKVEHKTYRGILLSPFPGAGRFGKATIKLENLKNGSSITWTPLHIHLIRDHGFFQGKGSKFRLDPEVLHKTLFE